MFFSSDLFILIQQHLKHIHNSIEFRFGEL